MNDTEVFRRYLYLGTDQPFFIRKNKPLDVAEGLRILAPIAALANATRNPANAAAIQGVASVDVLELPEKTVERVMESGTPVRNDECLFALAYLIRIYKTADRAPVFKLLPTLIKSSKDLFLFLHFYKILAPETPLEEESKSAPTKKSDETSEETSDDQPKKESGETPEGESGDKPKKKRKGKGKATFGHAIKGVLRKWYNKYTAEELAEMIASDRGWYGWCHVDILRMAHLNLKDDAKMQVLDKACGGKGVFKPRPKTKKNKGKSKVASSDAASGGEAKTVPMESETEGESTADEAKAQDSDAAPGEEGKNESSESKTGENPVEADELQVESEALLIFKRIKNFKKLAKIQDAVSQIKEQNYPLQLVPSQMHRAEDIWQSLFPNMSYRELIQAALVLQDYKLLKDPERPLCKAYGEKLNCMNSVAKSNISPIFIYQIMRLFEERQRYLCTVKESIHTSNNVGLKNIKPNPDVLKQFYLVLNQSILSYQPCQPKKPSQPKKPEQPDQPTQSDEPTQSDQPAQQDQPTQILKPIQPTRQLKPKKLRILVTLDLRSKQSKKRVFNNRLMSCQAAYILLTFPLLKGNNFVKVLSFTENKSELAEVDFTREMEFFQGCDHIQNRANKKTAVDITQPIKQAAEQKMEVDAFLTIVDSLIRVNPKRESPVEELNNYNKTMKKQARYIVVSLSRHQQDFNHRDMNSTKGVLELVGCSEEIPVVIDAYMRKHFV